MAHNGTKARWQRLHLSMWDLQQHVRVLEERSDRREQYGKGGDERAQRWMDILDYAKFACLCHLEYESNTEIGRHAAFRIPALAAEYFLGDWREAWAKANPTFVVPRTHPEFGWYDIWRWGLIFALVMDDEASLQALSTWVGNDLVHDEGLCDATTGDNQFLILLGFLFSDRTPHERYEQRQSVLESEGYKGRLCLGLLEAIEDSDRITIREQFSRLAHHNKNREFRDDRPDHAVMIEGTMLWHIARRNNVHLDDLPVDVMDRIIRQETLASVKNHTERT